MRINFWLWRRNDFLIFFQNVGLSNFIQLSLSVSVERAPETSENVIFRQAGSKDSGITAPDRPNKTEGGSSLAEGGDRESVESCRLQPPPNIIKTLHILLRNPRNISNIILQLVDANAGLCVNLGDFPSWTPTWPARYGMCYSPPKRKAILTSPVEIFKNM